MRAVSRPPLVGSNYAIITTPITDDRTRAFTHHEITAHHGMVHVTSRAASAAVKAVAREVPGVRAVEVVEIPAMLPAFPLP